MFDLRKLTLQHYKRLFKAKKPVDLTKLPVVRQAKAVTEFNCWALGHFELRFTPDVNCPCGGFWIDWNNGDMLIPCPAGIVSTSEIKKGEW